MSASARPGSGALASPGSAAEPRADRASRAPPAGLALPSAHGWPETGHATLRPSEESRGLCRADDLHAHPAFNEPLKGLTADELRYVAAGPAVDPSFIDEARKRFATESAYLDDRPGAPLRFLAEGNLSVVIRREEQPVNPTEARAQLSDRIRDIFDGKTFEAVPFPGGPFGVPDEVGDGRPKLVVCAYDGLAVGEIVEEVPS